MRHAIFDPRPDLGTLGRLHQHRLDTQAYRYAGRRLFLGGRKAKRAITPEQQVEHHRFDIARLVGLALAQRTGLLVRTP
mgnify:CR=1 FL=1